jgi:hypothetical protein
MISMVRSMVMFVVGVMWNFSKICLVEVNKECFFCLTMALQAFLAGREEHLQV